MFLTGFDFAAILVYTICDEVAPFPLEGNIGMAVGAGVLLGLVTMLIQYVGLFLTGFHVGVPIGLAALIVVEEMDVEQQAKWFPIIILVGLGLVSALLGLKFQKPLTILGTRYGCRFVLYVHQYHFRTRKQTCISHGESFQDKAH
jgi:hypothetical protein